MKRVSRLLLTGIVVLIIGYLVYGRRAQIAAKVWHWRHGYSTYVGDYVVPVPDHWLVDTSEDPRMITLIDTRVRRTADRLSAVNVITVSALSSPIRDLDSWASFARQRRERDGLREIEEKTIQAGDERMFCLGGYELRDIMRLPTAAVSLECRSSDRLNLGFTGHRSGLQEFYTIASQIRKRK